MYETLMVVSTRTPISVIRDPPFDKAQPKGY